VVRPGARSLNREIGTARLFDADEESCDLEYDFGLVSVRSRRAPAKTGPNEDAAAVIPVDGQAVVLAVADGVGGAPAGHEASATTMRILEQSLAQVADGQPARGAILDAIERSNEVLLANGSRSATTLVVAEISGDSLRCYHVGDSELIAVGQRGRIKLRVIPHSPTGFAVEAGLLGEEEAVQHEARHIISNVVGDADMRVDISAPVAIAPRDTVLLTTDGVLDNLYLDEIVDIIRVGPLAVAADRLIAAAQARMMLVAEAEPSKPDDATIVLYRRR
jgi:serine/threonine protein phosphatase PrpC